MLILDGPPLRLACDRCHKRKQRCTRSGINDNKPCERCREAGSHCVYSPPSRLGRPSKNSKRERQEIMSNSSGITTERRTSSNTTSPTSPPSHSFPLSSSSVSVPSYMPMTSGRIKTKVRRSHSTTAAASMRHKPYTSSTPSHFSDTTPSPSSYDRASPPLSTMDAASGAASFQNVHFPRSQSQQYHGQVISGTMMVPSPKNHSDPMLVAPGQQTQPAMRQDHGSNIILGSERYNDTVILGQQDQHQPPQLQSRPQPQPQPHRQRLCNDHTWPDVMATHEALQLHAYQEELRVVGSDGNAHPQWKRCGQPVADPHVANNLGIPVTMAMDENQPMFYYW